MEPTPQSYFCLGNCPSNMVFHSYNAINKEWFSLSQAWARSWKETRKPCWSVGQRGCCKTNNKTSEAVWVSQQKIYMWRWCKTLFSAGNAQEEFSATFQESLKTFWHRQGQERSASPNNPEFRDDPQLPLLQIVWVRANANAPLALWVPHTVHWRFIKSF